ncbi:MAG: hypothetical protein R3Y62_01040, partial [Eubacteriales bacterium]
LFLTSRVACGRIYPLRSTRMGTEVPFHAFPPCENFGLEIFGQSPAVATQPSFFIAKSPEIW